MSDKSFLIGKSGHADKSEFNTPTGAHIHARHFTKASYCLLCASVYKYKNKISDACWVSGPCVRSADIAHGFRAGEI